MPTSIFKCNKSCSTKTSYCLSASKTSFSKQFTITINAISIVWLISFVNIFNSFIFNISSCKSLACKRFVAITTIKTISMPRCITKSNASGNNYLFALGAFGSKFVFIAFDAFRMIDES